jgi:membrane protease YdiL (CAAX protease family)
MGSRGSSASTASDPHLRRGLLRCGFENHSTRRYDARVLNEPHRASPLIALLLLVPAPSIGVLLAMNLEATAGTTIGKAAYALAKVWLVVFPAVWLFFIERGKPSLSPPRHGGFGVGLALGVAIAVMVLGAEALIGEQLVDPATVRAQAEQNGLDSLPTFIALALYLALVNSVLEEYVWRWFVFRQCERLFAPGRQWLAVAVSALLFTVHHTIALKVQLDWSATLVASLGVFIGGAVWSWCYLKYRSIWPSYVSHLIVDAAILYLAWKYIFGS